jgi:major vault protein
LPLDQNEGVYVRNIRTGVVKTVIGEKYMLNEYEELWEK